MKNIIITSLALVMSLAVFSACGNDHSKHNQTAAPGSKYICPMNCEKGKTYDQPGTCPVCHMDLEPVKAAVTANKTEYFMGFKAVPEQLEAGKSAMLSFTPRVKGNESAPVPLDLVHEKKMHLILVSDDLANFDHIHPEYSAAGDYQIKVLGRGENYTAGRGKTETRFDAGGKFWAFADYKPTGGLNTVDKIEINVAGTPSKPMNFSAEKLTGTVDGYTVKMEGSGFTTGNQTHIPVLISKGGKPVDPTTFENYLGEKAHLVLIEVGSKEYVHTHPAAGGGKLDIHTTFAKPGTYRGWLQFQTDGMVHTADFVLKVAEGKGSSDGHTGH